MKLSNTIHQDLQNFNTTIVVSVYNENTNWTSKLSNHFDDIRIYKKCDENSLFNIPVNKGNEASVYLSYIVNNYDNLKDYNIFLHGDEYSWHHNGSLVDIIFNLKNLNKDYLNINNYTLGSIFGNHRFNLIKSWYLEYLENECGLMEKYGDWTVGHLGCAQFVVHKSLILSKSKKFYERLYDWIINTDLDNQTSGLFMEWTWHLIWNQVLKNND